MRIATLVLILLPTMSMAQWIGYPESGVPRAKDGAPILTAKTPRTREGKPDLSGVWHVLAESLEEKKKLFGPNTGRLDVPGMEAFTTSKYSRDLWLDLKPGTVALTKAGEDASARARVQRDTTNGCLPFGFPLNVHVSEFQKIVQTPKLILALIELDSMTRQIHTDGRKLPEDPSPSWLGYSVGRWEADTLVVDTIGFNGHTVLDSQMRPVGEKMHMTERYTRRDFGHMDIQMTFDDPEYYTKPFTVTARHLLQPDTDVLEYVCAENEKDKAHIPTR